LALQQVYLSSYSYGPTAGNAKLGQCIYDCHVIFKLNDVFMFTPKFLSVLSVARSLPNTLQEAV
jgi:hypothetical protein